MSSKRYLLEPALRIAQIAPVIESVPPKKYGGSERVINALTEELVKRGHQVTLFASGDSKTSANLISVTHKALHRTKMGDLYGLNAPVMLNIGLAYSYQRQFDIIHDHHAFYSLPTANLSRTPTVITVHNGFNNQILPLYETFINPYLVAISKAQHRTAPHLNYAGIVHNGLAMEHYPFSANHDGYLLFVGRMSPEKGLHYAIKVARKLKMPLVIAAKRDRNLPLDEAYYQRYIKSKLTLKNIHYVGEVAEKKRNQLMSKAMAILHPVIWPEPFGLTMIEAMACGCPVIAFNQGSIPEVVAHNKTGFVVNDVNEMVNAVKKIGTIDRSYCRMYTLKKFSAKRMADQYEKIYYAIIKHQTQQIQTGITSSVTKSYTFKHLKSGL